MIAPIHFDYEFDAATGIATVTLDRPDRLNALTFAIYGELRDTFRALSAEPTVRVVIITGTGDEFIGPKGSFGGSDQVGKLTPRQFDDLRPGAHQMLIDLLRIEHGVYS